MTQCSKCPKQSKITWHRENKENLKLVWENITNRTNNKAQILEHWVNYLTKIFKAGIKMLQQVSANSPETNGKLENHSKETDDIKNHQMGILELKNAIPEIENTLEHSTAEWKVSDMKTD